MAAAALAAGVLTSNAQVYSQNIVGYVNTSLTPNAYALVAPALDVDGTGTNGTITTVCGTNVASGTIVLVFNGTTYDTLEYSPVTHGGAPEWNLNGAAAGNFSLNCGEGFWMLDPSDTNLTQVGTVLQGTLTNAYFPPAAVYGLIGSQVPLAGGITTVLGYQPTSGDIVLSYNPTSGGYNTFEYSPVTHGGAPEWNENGTAAEPQIGVAQGFWILPAAANDWVETFTNN